MIKMPVTYTVDARYQDHHGHVQKEPAYPEGKVCPSANDPQNGDSRENNDSRGLCGKNGPGGEFARIDIEPVRQENMGEEFPGSRGLPDEVLPEPSQAETVH